MALAIKALLDKKRVALVRARFKAWWEGEAFDEEAALAAIEAAANDTGESAAAEAAAVENELFDAPAVEIAPRLRALMLVWGDQRLRPGDDTADALEPARIGLEPEGVAGVLGAGLAGPLIAFAGAHPGKIEAFEWREEAVEALRAGVAKAGLAERVSVARIDLEAHVWAPNLYDGIWSVDDFAYAGYPPHLAQQIAKSLKPGACAVVECYAGLRTPEFATAFASSFAEPQIRARGDLVQFFVDVGLTLEADEDLTEEFLDLARQGFKRLGAALADASGLEAPAARELAWEAGAWRARLKLLAQRRLERRRFIVRKSAEAQASSENANAPSA